MGFSISTQAILMFSCIFVIVIIITSTFSALLISQNYFYAKAACTKAVPAAAGPIINDPNLKVEILFKGLKMPTSIAFLGTNDILVL